MIYLYTGLPGAGKTLFTLADVKKRAEEEGRQVYYSGIKDLNISSWIELENPEKWYELPDGAIIVIDECQRFFRPRGNGSAVPKCVSELETHRHKGYDIYLITQHPMMLDQNVRRLTGCHMHVVRNFGTNKVTIHEFGSVRDNCDKSRKDSTRHERFYPKEIFNLYKSAEIHTHKARIPFKVWFYISCPILFIILVAAAVYQIYNSRAMATETAKKQEQHQLKKEPEKNNSTSFLTDPNKVKNQNPQVALKDYIDARKPRFEGFPNTAPIYDSVTASTVAPYPAACLTVGKRCRCYTQQSTIIDVPDGTCRSIVERGYFVDWAQPKNDNTQNSSTQLAQQTQPEEPYRGGVIAGPGRYDHPIQNEN